MSFYRLLIYSLMFSTAHIVAETLSLGNVAADMTSATIQVTLDKNEAILQDSISFSTDDPNIRIESWHSSAIPQSPFDKISNASRNVYTGTFTINIALSAAQNAPHNSPTLFMHYAATHHKLPQERTFILPTGTLKNTNSSTNESSAIPTHTTSSGNRRHYKDGMPVDNNVLSLFEQAYAYLHHVVTMVKNWVSQFKDSLSSTFSSSSSHAFQIMIAFLLGILMSLTPCIYPMIPITIGLLGASASNSWVRNFLLASLYTVGMGLTFALLGLVTVFFGTQCGALMCNSWFIVLIIAFLAYCGGSMLGLYEFHTPAFLQPSNLQNTGGSLSSTFLFGMLSGTFASPCMSPGLALILSAAATIGNYVLAFLLLFSFGIGASMPLLIIGTFSGALHFLPRAGLWMNDIKKAFGFLLIMMCFYYAQTLITVHIAWAGAAIFACICGTLYATRIRYVKTFVGATFITLVSSSLLCIGLFSGYSAFMAWHASTLVHKDGSVQWLSDYQEARKKAQAEHKLVLADFTASWCSMCGLLDKEILQHPDVAPIFDAVVTVKIDGSSSKNIQYRELLTQFKLHGIPQLLLIDPTSENVIQSWSSELLGQPASLFRDQLLSRVQ